MRTLLALIFFLESGTVLAITPDSLPRELERASRNSRPEALKAIVSLQTLLASDSAIPLGLSIAEAGTLSLGKPLPIITVSLDKLRSFKAGKSTFALLSGPSKVIYPILSGATLNATVRTSVVVDWYKGRWRMEALGGSGLISRLAAARDNWNQSRSLSHDAGQIFAVQIPDLDTFFLADGAHGENWQLIALEDKGRWQLKKWQGVPAASLFLRVALQLQ